MTRVFTHMNSSIRVLLQLPNSELKFRPDSTGVDSTLESFQVMHWMGAVDYKIWQPGKRKETQIYHINLLKAWWRSAAQSRGSLPH